MPFVHETQPHLAPSDQAEAPDIALSIIIVSWNVWPLLRDCLASIEHFTVAVEDVAQNGSITASQGPYYRAYGPQQERLVEVIVVDNDSHDETMTALPNEFPWVHLICTGGNLGFTRGNNIGYEVCRGEFVFFLNPDTSLTAVTALRHEFPAFFPPIVEPVAQEDATASQTVNPLNELHRVLIQDPTIGMVGPQLRYGDGTWQNSRRRFPTRWTGFFESTWLGQFWKNNPWTKHMHMLDQEANGPHEVDWLNGSAMFCRRAALEAICTPDESGPFDEQFFMYSEELDLCQRIVQAGWRILYIPNVTIVHYEGRSSEQVVTSRHIFFNTSKVRYYRKYFGPQWATLMRGYLYGEYLLQIGLESLKWLLRHKPALREDRIGAYRAVLRSGFRTYFQ